MMIEEIMINTKKLVIYGSGKKCRDFLKKIDKKNVVGILDRLHIGGEVDGVEIISWDQVWETDANVLVIASKEQFYKEIYNRIFDNCLARGLLIYNDKGQNLMQLFGIPHKRDLCYTEISEIKSMLRDYDVISFDVFDTVLLRKVVDPIDIFDFVEIELKRNNICIENFKVIRRECELETKGRKLEDIYNTIKRKLQLSQDLIQQMMKVEIECEEKYIVPNDLIVNIIEYAKEMDKQVIFVSDMYLSQKDIATLLNKNGVYEYTKLYVSCEYDKGKGDELFDVVSKDLNNRRCLHIGDNEYLDGVCPRKFGIDSVVISTPKQNYKKSGLGYSLSFTRNINDRSLLGSLISDVFKVRDSLEIDNLKDLAEIFCVPFAILYFDKIFKMISEEEYEGVLFPARDGFYLQKLFDEIKKILNISIPSYYIPSSRKLMVRTGSLNKEDIIYAEKYSNIVTNPIADLFGVPEAEITDENREDLIISYSKKCREKYKLCLQSMGINVKKKYLLCELNGQGTTQHYLRRFFSLPLDTVYLVRWHNGDDMESTAVYDFYGKDRDYSCLNSRFDILEMYFSAPHPSIIDLYENLSPVYSLDNRTATEIRALEKMHEFTDGFIIDYFRDCYSNKIELTAKVEEQILNCFEDVTLVGNAKVLEKGKYYDDLMNKYVDCL